jgi:hypothetical protein
MRYTGPQGMAAELASGVAWTNALSALSRGARR